MGVLAPALAAEQLDLQPVGPHGRAIERDERAGRPPRARMQEAGDDLLADPGGTGDQHAAPVGATRSICWRSWLAAGELPTSSNSGPARKGSSSFSRGSWRRLDGAFHDQQQAVGLERLFDEVIGAELDRLDRRFDIAMAADHGDRKGGQLAAEMTLRISMPSTASCPAAGEYRG